MDHLCVWVKYAIYVCGLCMSHGFKNSSQQSIGVKCTCHCGISKGVYSSFITCIANVLRPKDDFKEPYLFKSA